MSKKPRITEIPIGPAAPGVSIMVLDRSAAQNVALIQLKMPDASASEGYSITDLRHVVRETGVRINSALYDIQEIFAEHNALTGVQPCNLPEGAARERLIAAIREPILTILEHDPNPSNRLAKLRASQGYSRITAQLESALRELPQTRSDQLEEACLTSSFYRHASPDNGHTRMQQAMRNALQVVAGKWDEESGPPNPDAVFVEVLGELQRHPANARPAGFQPRFSGGVRR